MKTKNININFLLVFLCGIFFLACDSVDDDQLPVNEQGDFDSETFVAPGSLAVIDISSGIKSNQALKLKITNAPNFGSLENLGGPLLKYQPNDNFDEGLDFFNIEIKSASDEYVGTKKVRIKVSRDSTDLPCAVIAFADYARTPVDQPVLIDVLKNDWDCTDQPIDSTSLKIKYPPSNGVASIQGSRVRFEPSPGFSGITEFIYGISSKDDTLSSYALVQVMVGKDSVANCIPGLQDDAVNFSQAIDSTLFINVLENDSLCATVVGQVKISIPPAFGQANFVTTDSSSWIVEYQLDTLPVQGNDQFSYQVCDDSTCYEANVTINFDHCFLRANQDYIVINSDSSIYANNSYPLDVLNNDEYCNNDSIQLRIVTPTSNGQVSVDARQLLYSVTGNTIQSDSLIYEICNGAQVCDSAKVYINFQQ